jgi:MFS family permease
VKRWVIWGLGALFFLYEFVLRVAPSTMVPELMEAFDIDATGVGDLSAFYLYAYAPLQIPIGILMDRIGARRSLTFAALACGVGSLLFGLAPVFWVAALGRLLMGAGSAFAFIGFIYITAKWFPDRWLATLVGLGSGFGFAGGLIGDDTLVLSVQLVGWRPTSIILGISGLLLALLMRLALKGDQNQQRGKLRGLFYGLRVVCRNWQSWLNGVVSGLAYAATSAFAGLWAIPFFVGAYGATKVEAGLITSALFLGWVIGSPLIGRLSDYWGPRKPWVIGCSFVAAAIMGALIQYDIASQLILMALMFLVGLLSAAQLLTFSVAIEINREEVRGTATAFTNFVVMLFGMVLQPLIGFLLVRGWDGTQVEGVDVYSDTDLRHVMLLFPLFFLIASLLALLYREEVRRGHREEAP